MNANDPPIITITHAALSYGPCPKGCYYASQGAYAKSILTEREYQIVVALSKGKRTKEVAQDFAISPFTVQSHITHIYHKLQAKSLVHVLAILTNFP